MRSPRVATPLREEKERKGAAHLRSRVGPGGKTCRFIIHQELEWVRPVIVFHATVAVKPKASKMYYTSYRLSEDYP